MADLGLNSFLVRENPDLVKIDAEKIQGSFDRPDVLGTGAFRVVLSDEVETNSPTVGTGTTWLPTVEVELQPPVLSVPDLLWSIYVDNDETAAWLYPDGGSLTSSNRPRVLVNFSARHSDPANGSYVYKFAVKNESAGDQTYYLKVQALAPFARS